MDDPQLRPVAPSRGRDEALVYIPGYLSEDDGVDEIEKWTDAIRAAGWQGALYSLWWDASSLKRLPHSGLLAVNHFNKVKSRAKRVGRDHLPRLLQKSIPERSVSLFGFSMGARVVYATLLSGAPNIRLNHAFVVGGALRRDSSKRWGQAASQLQGKLLNVYNKDDVVLKRLYETISLGQSPCGRKPIKERHPQIVNIDARRAVNSSSLKNHWKYRHHLDPLIGRYLRGG